MSEDPLVEAVFIKPLRLISVISLDGWGATYSDETPPDLLYRVVRYESYSCDCCSGGENVVVSEHQTRPEADLHARHADAWVEAWDATFDGMNHWRKLPPLARHEGLPLRSDPNYPDRSAVLPKNTASPGATGGER